MDLRELQSLVRGGESEVVEFKRKANYPEKIMKEVVAFANTHGGDLLIGVDDDGTLAGLKHVHDDAFVLERALAKHCRPAVEYDQQIIRLSEKKSIIHYRIHESERKPHYVVDVAAEQGKKAYVRVADRSVQASREAQEILRRRRRNKDIRFVFGDRERQLMQYLDEHGTITLVDYAQLIGTNRYKASRTLVLLVLANVLELIPREGGDHYALKPSFAG